VWMGGTVLATYLVSGPPLANPNDPGNPLPNSTLHFYLNDPLGTRRVQTDYAGVLEQTCASLPYGNGETCTPYPTEHLFTGKERDAESGNDYFGARYYASSIGRFLSPDWSAKVAPVPYANLDDPQSLNLYTFVLNNPLSFVDLDGHRMDCTETPIKGPDGKIIDITTCTVTPDPPTDSSQQCDELCQEAQGEQRPAENGLAKSNAPNSVFNRFLNYEKRVVSCNLDTLKKNGVAVGLDATSLGADVFGPEEQYAKLAVGLTLSTGAMINSAANRDMTGTGLGMASYLKAPTELAATSAGWAWAKWIPGAGAIMDGYSAYHDISLGMGDYNRCMAGH
jgi:RHS repeat-associated protein